MNTKKNSLKHNLNAFKTIYLMSFKNYFKMHTNVLQGFFLSIVILFCWLTFKNTDPFILISLIGGTVLRNGFYTFHRSLLIYKRSGWDSRIKVLPLNAFIRRSATLCFSITLNIFITIILFGLAMLCFPQQRIYLENINWLMVSSGLFLLWLISTLMSYLIDMSIKKTSKSQIWSIVLFNLAWNLLGCSFPYYIIAQYNWLNILLYIFPQRYMFNVIQAGWVNATNLEYNFENYHVDFKLAGQIWIPYVITFGIITIILLFLLFKYLINIKSQVKIQSWEINDYINSIKKATSLEELLNIKKYFEKNEKR